MAKPTETSTIRNVVSMPATGRAETVMAETHVYRLEQQQTGGAMVCTELVIPPGHGLPPHTHHREDETFYIVEGAIDFGGDDLSAAVRVPQGGLLHSPRGRMHSFRNTTDTPSRMLVFITPGENMQRMFAALAELTVQSQGHPTVEDVRQLCAGYEIMFSPPETTAPAR